MKSSPKFFCKMDMQRKMCAVLQIFSSYGLVDKCFLAIQREINRCYLTIIWLQIKFFMHFATKKIAGTNDQTCIRYLIHSQHFITKRAFDIIKGSFFILIFLHRFHSHCTHLPSSILFINFHITIACIFHQLLKCFR